MDWIGLAYSLVCHSAGDQGSSSCVTDTDQSLYSSARPKCFTEFTTNRCRLSYYTFSHQCSCP